MEDNKMRDEVIEQITEYADDATEVIEKADDSVKRGAIIAVGLLGVGMALGVGITKGAQTIGKHFAEKKRLRTLRNKAKETADEGTQEGFEDGDFVEIEK